ncbi:MAG: EamA family transporter [Holdemanella porci]
MGDTMWILYATGSAFLRALLPYSQNVGFQKQILDVATAIRTIVVLVFSWILVLLTGTISGITDISGKTLLFLVLSGIATGASWLCYFKALQNGNVNKVVPIDKSSTILTILLACIFFHEGLSLAKIGCVCMIGVGTMLMITRKEDVESNSSDKSWLMYAILSAVFASLTSILGKIGISGIDSNLGTAIRTSVVLVMAWLMVFVKNKQSQIKDVDRKELLFIILSGFATGGSWLCFYRALQDGLASIVVPIDKLSILVTIGFSRVVFHEKLSKKALLGLILITVGTVTMTMI